jgi:RimJ/RimL family protein N-acetyltransferase
MSASIRPIFLTGARVALRPLLANDKEHAAAWFDSPFPIDATRAQAFLKEAHQGGWPPPPQHLAIVRAEGDEIIGGATTRGWNGRTVWLAPRMAPWVAEADDLRAEAVRLLVPWLRDEREYMVVRLAVEADQPATLAAAEALGMVRGARLRERLARPGGRVDLFYYEALNPRWEVRDA